MIPPVHQMAVFTLGLPGFSGGTDSARHNLSLEDDIRLMKPALLYSARPTLVSVAYSANEIFHRAVSQIDTHPHEVILLIDKFFPSFILGSEWQHIVKKAWRAQRHPVRERRAKMRAELQVYAKLLMDKVPMKIADIGDFSALKEAHRKGILEIEEIEGLDAETLAKLIHDVFIVAMESVFGRDVNPEVFVGLSRLIRGATARLVRALGCPGTYPVLDQEARRLIATTEPNQLISETARQRSRVGGLANHVLGSLPLVRADFDTINEIRVELQSQLGEFHVEMANIAAQISSSQWDASFQEDSTHLFATRIEPIARELTAKIAEFKDPAHTRMVRRSAAWAAAEKGGKVYVGVCMTAPLVADWVDVITVGTAALPLALGAAMREFAQELKRTIEAELQTLQENRLYYLAAAHDALLTRTTVPTAAGPHADS